MVGEKSEPRNFRSFIKTLSSSSSSPDSESPTFDDESAAATENVDVISNVVSNVVSNVASETSKIEMSPSSSMVPLEPFVHQVSLF
jgi:hypothetical protein